MLYFEYYRQKLHTCIATRDSDSRPNCKTVHTTKRNWNKTVLKQFQNNYKAVLKLFRFRLILLCLVGRLSRLNMMTIGKFWSTVEVRPLVWLVVTFRYWFRYQPIFSDNSSLCSTLQLVWCSGYDATTTSLTPLQSSTGCVYHNGSTMKLRSSRFKHCNIPGSTSSRCWSVWLSSSALILITPAAGSGISSSYCRPTFVSSCCIHPLEQPASCLSVILLLGRFLPQTKDTLVTPIVSRHLL